MVKKNIQAPEKVEEVKPELVETKVEEKIEAVDVTKEEELFDVEDVEEQNPIKNKSYEAPVEEIKVKGFKNVSDKGMKIKLIDGRNVNWITVKAGQTVTIPEKLALANKLVEVE